MHSKSYLLRRLTGGIIRHRKSEVLELLGFLNLNERMKVSSKKVGMSRHRGKTKERMKVSSKKDGMSRHRESINRFSLRKRKEMKLSSSEGDVGKSRCREKAKESFHNQPKMISQSAEKLVESAEIVTNDSLNLRRYSLRLRNSRINHSNNGKKLNTSKFEAYLEYLWNSISKVPRHSFTYVDCLWFHLYKNELQTPKVLGWLKNQKIFSWTYVFVPIVCWNHWSLLILCHFGKSMICMLLLDSLNETEPMRLEPDIRRFVLDIYRAEERRETEEFISNIPLLIPKVPQQRDGEECGMFVLYFIYLFVQDAPKKFKLNNYPCFLKKDWFTWEQFESFRDELNSNFLNKVKKEIIDIS